MKTDKTEEGKANDNASTGDNQIITLCGVSGCCPTVRKTEAGGVEIRDDNGGTVTLTADEFTALQRATFGS